MIKAGSERGMALLLVLVVVTLLTAIMMELSYSTLIEQRLTETFRDSTRAYYLARGGITAGQKLLLADNNEYDASSEIWGGGVSNYPVGEGFVSLVIEDLNGKLAVNSLVIGNNPQTVAVDRFYRLLLLLEIDEPAELTAGLVDWLDQGSTPFNLVQTDGAEIAVSGAENGYYQSLAKPYTCQNGPLKSLEELRLIKGFTQQVFNLVSPYLSIADSKRININTAEPEVLKTLSTRVDEQTIDLIVENRRAAPIKSIQHFETLLPVDQFSILKSLANQRLLGTTSHFYKIMTEAVVNDGRCSLETRFDKKNKTLSYIRTI